MSIMPMKKINICALKKDRKKLLEALQIMGVMEIRDFSENDEIFKKIDTKKTMEVFKDNAKVAREASKTLSKYIPDNDKVTSLTGRKSISTKDYYNFVNESEEFMKIGYTIVNTEKTISESRNKIVNLKFESEYSWDSEKNHPARYFYFEQYDDDYIAGMACTRHDIGSDKLKKESFYELLDYFIKDIITKTRS